MTPPVSRGVGTLRALVDSARDLRTLDRADFRRWLARHLARWRHDPVFRQRARVRDLRRAHPELLALETARRAAERADVATPQAARLRQVERAGAGADKAIAGLAAAELAAPVEKRAALAAKRAAFEERRRALHEEQARLIASSPERRMLQRLDAELRAMRAALGLDREQAELDALMLRRGRQSGRSGSAFERLALELTERALIPELTRNPTNVRVLRGVTLGAADVEIDLAVVRHVAGRPVDVLAIVEVKRNVNDLAHGFRRRQGDLAWLTGDGVRQRTATFPTGRFDRPATHTQDGEAFIFAPGSFRCFRRDGDHFLRRLYFVTRTGPVWGVSSAALARIAFRVATDERWDSHDDANLSRLLAWCRSLVQPVETADVLRLYAASAALARRVLVVER